MDENTPWDEEHRLAHATGRLEWGMWLCDCAGCREVCRRLPDVLLVIKGSAERKFVTAGQLAEADPEELIEQGYVREVFVAEVQPLIRPSRRRLDESPHSR